CGGYQMLGNRISDLDGVEEGGSLRGMELLPIETTLKQEKVRTQRKTALQKVQGELSDLNGKEVLGYEIHMGDTVSLENGTTTQKVSDNRIIVSHGKVYGTYLHGIFDAEGIASVIVKRLAEKKGLVCDTSKLLSYAQFKEAQYDKLADTLREYLDMDFIYGILGEARI
ncbi:MAG: cobyric acid synthase CobQ, partial [Lachnospiraceae bacterium]|nr:cobyric acid synthase CobQ [Lachnospiraceae bacterium]